MAKKKQNLPDQISEWDKVIQKQFDDKRERDQLLEPSRPAIPRIVNSAQALGRMAHYIQMTSDMAHEGLLAADKAQRLIDNQIKHMTNEMTYLSMFLKKEDEE
ncbi:hypothetical protein IM043_gp089 [Bacillus phage SPG24]|uniref:hypothetical protein n=1 Tax=Bacillus phage SPG24 TaxID=1497851 RepID=UPI0022BA2774|nr:hypothetical protein IM043_gp089 [Bacillus phage SPG24]